MMSPALTTPVQPTAARDRLDQYRTDATKMVGYGAFWLVSGTAVVATALTLGAGAVMLGAGAVAAVIGVVDLARGVAYLRRWNRLGSK